MLRRRSRSVRLVVNVAGNFAARAINLVAAFLTVPMAVHGLGTHDYAIFAVILSSATFVAYADFGMGLAMVNPITATEAKGDHQGSREIVSQTWSLLTLIAVGILVGGSIVVAGITSVTEHGWSVMGPWFVFVACVAVALPTALTQRLLFALERNYEANLWMSAGRICALAGVFVAYHVHAGLGGYVFAMLGLPALLGWINTYWLFRRSRPDLAPYFVPPLKTTSRLLPQGLRYTVLQIGPYAEIGFDVILIGSFLGAQATTSYDLLSRAFNYVPALATIGFMPLWPALSAALANGDHRWAASVKRLSEIVLLATTIAASAVLALYHTEVLKLWTGLNVQLPELLAIQFAIVSVLTSYVGLKNSVILASQGANRLATVQILFLFALIPLKFASIPLWGITGPTLITIILYIPRLIAVVYIQSHPAPNA